MHTALFRVKGGSKSLLAVAHLPWGRPLAPPACLAGGLRAFAEYRELQRTPLFDFHVEQGGKMVPFAGWEMPIQYKDSLMDSAKWCRTHACIFDVSHMCAVTIQGKDAVRFLERLVVGDIQGLPDGTGTLTVITNENGGIIDDSVTTKVNDEHIYMVFNAACRDKDTEHFNDQLKHFDGDAKMIPHDERSLIALQGPKAHEVLQQHVSNDLSKIYFGHFVQGVNIAGAGDCWMMRTGYTGEDGFELSIPAESVESVTRKLCESEDVKMAGLGARDSLRLEAGLCLYGNDLTEDTTPLEASLKWTIGKRRRETCDFIGGEAIKRQMAEGITRRRVGILSSGAPPRPGAELLLAEDGTKVGTISSGAFSPNLNKNVGMAYVDKPHDKVGTKLKVVVRGKESDAEVAKPPFVQPTYYKG